MGRSHNLSFINGKPIFFYLYHINYLVTTLSKQKQSYSLEFRAEAVKVVLEQGLSLAEAARRLALPKGTLATWVGQAKGGKGLAAPGSRSVSELEAEIRRLHQELAETQRERESVKKAAATFAKESLPGTRS
jgi:transposase